jgi:hypothetical protein
MVCPITGAKSYVCETGKSMNGEQLAASQHHGWRNIPISLTMVNESNRQLERPNEEVPVQEEASRRLAQVTTDNV